LIVKPIPAAANQAGEITSFQFHPVLRVVNVSETGTISGHVWNNAGTPGEVDDTPIASATVTVLASGVVQSTTATGAQGEFRISGLKPGTQTIRVEMIGFNPVEVQTTVVVATDIDGHEIRLSPVEESEL